MSYDIRIKNEEKPLVFADLKNYVNSLPNITDQRLKIGDDYYMEIYLEFATPDGEFTSPSENGPVNCINLCVPYAFMNKLEVDHEVYHQLAKHLAHYMHTRAYDLQLDIYLDEASFQIRKRRGLLKFCGYSAVKLVDGNKLMFDDSTFDSEHYPFSINLVSLDITQEMSKVNALHPYIERNSLNCVLSPDKKLVAVSNLSTKSLKVFHVEGENYMDLLTLWESQAICECLKCGKILRMSFSDDSKSLFTTAVKSTALKNWDCSTGKLIRNYSSYDTPIHSWIEINDNLLCTVSHSGISFITRKNGKTIVHVHPSIDNWVVFTPNGDYEFKTPTNLIAALGRRIDNALLFYPKSRLCIYGNLWITFI